MVYLVVNEEKKEKARKDRIGIRPEKTPGGAKGRGPTGERRGTMERGNQSI